MISLGPRRLFGFLLLSAILVGCNGEPAAPVTPPADATPAPTSSPAPKTKDPVGADRPIMPK